MRAYLVLFSAALLTACPVEPSGPNAAVSSSAIVGGANAGEHPPYVVRFGSSALPHYCAGSILNSNWVLTAAHCVDEVLYPTGDAVIVAGDLSISTTEGTEAPRLMSMVVVHPSWNTPAKQNDLALVKLSTALQLGGVVNSIALAPQTPSVGQTGFALGWGQTTQVFGPNSDALKVATLDVSPRAECSAAYGSPPFNTPIGTKQFCAYESSPYASIAQGDGGGPFVSGLIGAVGLSGVASMASPQLSYPGVFVDVAAYRDWIEEVAFDSAWLRATQDAHVRAGTYANDNYGKAVQGEIKNDPNTNYDKELYLTFNLTTTPGPVLDATLSLYCRRNGTDTPTPEVRLRRLDTAGESWDEDTLTWNNRYTSGTDIETKTFPEPGWRRYTWSSNALRDSVASQLGGPISFRLSAINAASTSSVLCVMAEDPRISMRPMLQVRTQ